MHATKLIFFRVTSEGSLLIILTWRKVLRENKNYKKTYSTRTHFFLIMLMSSPQPELQGELPFRPILARSWD